jgi:microcystin-dependent protein
MSFRVTNTSQNVIANKLNYDIIPRLQSHIALQVGDYKISARSSDINGWMVCNGRSLLRSDYPALFSVIGTDFGSVDGTHFNLPDYTSKVIGMYGPTMGSMTGYTERERGDIVGHETIQLTVPQLPAHSHTGTTDSSGAHTHGITDPGHTHSYVNNVNDQSTDDAFSTETAADQADISQTTGSSTTGISVNSAGAHTHTFTTQNTGENDDIDVMQPTLFGSSVLIFAKFMKNYQLVPTTWA